MMTPECLECGKPLSPAAKPVIYHWGKGNVEERFLCRECKRMFRCDGCGKFASLYALGPEHLCTLCFDQTLEGMEVA